jgi:hypothetical protein
MIMTHEQVRSALACSVEVIRQEFTIDGEGRRRVCGHGHVKVTVGPNNLSLVRCSDKRCGHSWKMHHPPRSLERAEFRLARAVKEASVRP